MPETAFTLSDGVVLSAALVLGAGLITTLVRLNVTIAELRLTLANATAEITSLRDTRHEHTGWIYGLALHTGVELLPEGRVRRAESVG